MSHVVGGEYSLKSSAPYLLWFVIYDILKIGRKRRTESLNELINDKGVCRTAPATPGLLIKLRLRRIYRQLTHVQCIVVKPKKQMG